ncbi:MAG: hypothetical protein Ct9H300mP7_5710 [Verrucomicrobiota bacterium]|nr:MAG: hypothetical protein Ct9H300mP7_5710 [Verrucomicrobiota bacterium]
MYAGYPKYAQHYYGCITALDEQIGRLGPNCARWVWLKIRSSFFAATMVPRVKPARPRNGRVSQRP